MRYKTKSVTALQMALGGLLAKRAIPARRVVVESAIADVHPV